MAGKLKVGIFSFSCCEDSSIVFVELLNEHYKEWLKLVDFRYARILQTKNDPTGLDVAFVEGAVANEKDRQKVLDIRKNSKKVVAIGSCACNAQPAGQRNMFDEETKREIQFIVDKFKMAPKVESIPEVIKVDDLVAGCPMDENHFIAVLNKYLEEFGIVEKTAKA
ncbi:MAG: hypothetical protein AABX01_03230 [Candidatus Micrarchaeota archaeon]